MKRIERAGRRLPTLAILAILASSAACGTRSLHSADSPRAKDDRQASPSQATASSPPRKLIFVGDIMLSRGVGQVMRNHHDWAYPFLKIAPEIRSADLAFANLECPVSDKGRNLHHYFSFRADPRSIAGLKYAGFRVVSQANNHAYDWGPDALLDTLARLRAVDILPVGAGANDRAAHTPVIVNVRGLKVGFLAYVGITPRSATATSKRAGVAWLDPARIVEDIRATRPYVDFLVVSLHWGVEYALRPSRRQVAIAHRLVDAGADLVIGAHPHVVQPIEKYRGRWIAYSLGNFIFDQHDPDTKRGLMLKVTLTGNQVSNIQPVWIDIGTGYQATVSPRQTPAPVIWTRANASKTPSSRAPAPL